MNINFKNFTLGKIKFGTFGEYKIEDVILFLLIIGVLYYIIMNIKCPYTDKKEKFSASNIDIDGDDFEKRDDQKESLFVKSEEMLLANKVKPCAVDEMDDGLYRFATEQKCDNCMNEGCSVCQMKHNDEVEIMEKLRSEIPSNSCVVTDMDKEVQKYMKSLVKW